MGVKEDLGFQILDLLKAHEFKLAELYTVFAEKDAANKKFWERMSREEVGHAGMLDRLRKDIASGKNRFLTWCQDRPQIIRETATLEQSIAEARTRRTMPAAETLGRALVLERSIVEHRFYDVVEDDCDTVTHFKVTMAMSLDKHIEGLRKLVDGVGKTGGG